VTGTLGRKHPHRIQPILNTGKAPEIERRKSIYDNSESAKDLIEVLSSNPSAGLFLAFQESFPQIPIILKAPVFDGI
jgi:hypothetical protein